MSTIHDIRAVPRDTTPLRPPFRSPLRPPSRSPSRPFHRKLLDAVKDYFDPPPEPYPDTPFEARMIRDKHARLWREWQAQMHSQFPPPDQEAQSREWRTNEKIFQKKFLSELVARGHKGKVAIMQNGGVLEIVPAHSAHDRAMETIPGELYSVHIIWDTPRYIGPRYGWVHYKDPD